MTGSGHADALLRATFDVVPDGVWAAPGRVNLIGEHLDYNGGPSLPFALPQRTYAAVRPRNDDVVRVVSGLAPGQPWIGTTAEVRPGGVSGWAAYATGPLWALRMDGFEVGGFDAALASTVPVGAGLSSSAAIECAVALALDDCFGLGLAAAGDTGRRTLAQACVRAENEVAGAPTGGMDQAASLLSRNGHALLLDPHLPAPDHVPLDLTAHDLEILVIDTLATHSLDDGQYAKRRTACESAAARLGVDFLANIDDAARALMSLPDEEEQRLTLHVISETRRTRTVVDLLRENRIHEIGDLLRESHESLRDDYRVSCPELDIAVEAAMAAGALGARMTGGGFGGSAIALTPTALIQWVEESVTRTYLARGWAAPGFHRAVPSEGAARTA